MIDEKKLIEKIEEWRESLKSSSKDDLIRDVLDAVMDIAMNEIPKTGKWIPTTERLPDNSEHDWVLAQVQSCITGDMWIPKAMEYRASKDDWYDDGEFGGWLKERHGDLFKVIAWMPLPEPCRRVDE